MKIKNVIIIYLLGCLLIACKQNQKKSEETNQPKSEEVVQKSEESMIYGNYVAESYAKRDQGYDWVAVTVKQGPDDIITISIRSRADKKKPSCTFDGKAYKKDDSTYESIYDGARIIYRFSGDSITISTEAKEDESVLYFFCSGGASLSGTYKKIQEPLDSEQIDKTSFSKVLNLQGIGFNISSIEKNGKNTLSILSFGLEEREFNETFEIEGSQIIEAEVEDLNSDGSPELLIYIQSEGSGSYGEVMAFSGNNNKSMSQVYFPPLIDNDEVNEGYMGHDSFSVVETSLAQRFPIYKKGDTNANPTGGIRQVSYKLIDGEASRKFEMNKHEILEINTNDINNK
ncbi:MAG: PliI family lysozyme inhibitor of I-type lysozyme [Eudoraea sp.]